MLFVATGSIGADLLTHNSFADPRRFGDWQTFQLRSFSWNATCSGHRLARTKMSGWDERSSQLKRSRRDCYYK